MVKIIKIRTASIVSIIIIKLELLLAVFSEGKSSMAFLTLVAERQKKCHTHLPIEKLLALYWDNYNQLYRMEVDFEKSSFS